MKKNELVPVGNGESFTRCGWIRLALKTLFEDPHASFFVETSLDMFLPSRFQTFS